MKKCFLSIIVALILLPLYSFADFNIDKNHLLYYPILQGKLDKDFKPSDLVSMSDYGINVMRPNDTEGLIRLVLAKDLKLFQSFCENQVGQKIPIRSGFRSYLDQQGAYAKNSYLGGSAIPGTSEHQLGLAIDFGYNEIFFDDYNFPKITKCLRENANKFGFVLSYEKGNPYYSYEPWHFRYVGKNYISLIEKNKLNNTPWIFFKNSAIYLREEYLAKFNQRIEEKNKKQITEKNKSVWNEISNEFNLSSDLKAMIFVKKNILSSLKNGDRENFCKFSSAYKYLISQP